MKRLILVIALVLVGASHAHAAWQVLEGLAWKGEADANGTYDLLRTFPEANLPKEKVQGKWVRVTASTDASQPDFHVWLHVFDGQNRPTVLPMPTMCTVKQTRNVCQGVMRFPKHGHRFRAALWAKSEPSHAKVERVEVAEPSSTIKAKHQKRFDEVLEHFQKNYYKKDAVDWPAARADAQVYLHAPDDVDPVPHAVHALLRNLPERAHMRVYAREQQTKQSAHLPTCKKLPNQQWVLSLPEIGSDAAHTQPYIEQAHRCLSRSDQWLIDLTNNMGGNVFPMFAALAPVFGQTELVMWQNADGEAFKVRIHGRSVLNQDIEQISWGNAALWPVINKATFVIGQACASSCEAVAIAAKKRFTLVGQKTAGLTTANDQVSLNEHLYVTLTSALMVDLDGVHHPHIQPDVPLSQEQTEQLLGKAGSSSK